MNGFETIRDMLPFLIPLVVIEIALLVIALVDLDRRERVKGGNKLPWVLLIVLVSIIGPIVYFILGRNE